MSIRIKRIHEPVVKSDGIRILVDRLWPRGITKERAQLDEWNKVLPPSNELRKAFHGGRMDFTAFTKAYRQELQGHLEDLNRIRELAKERTVTLLYASVNAAQNHARVLLGVLDGGGS